MTVTEKLSGLSSAEAARRLLIGGSNELPSQKTHGFISIFINVLRDPMLLLLLASGAIYLLIGEPRDAWMLLTFVLVVIAITFYQERKTEHALEALKQISSPVARVLRDGVERKIPSRELVVDDVIFLHEGDRIPADATVLTTANLLVDESVLTGESVSVRKSPWNGLTRHMQPGGEDLPFVYSGTLVTQGRATVKVLDTGVHTEVGKIGRSLQTIKTEDTLLKRETGAIMRTFAIVGVSLCLVIIVMYGIVHGAWLQGVLAGLTLSMAMLPEEFSVVLVVFLTLGAWRMSKHKVLVRKTPAIEALGAATVLCVDKTGTLTENKMELDGLWVSGRMHDVRDHAAVIPDEYHKLLEFAALASQKDPYDPIEKEIISHTNISIPKQLSAYDSWSVIREYPLSSEMFSVSHVWKSPKSNEFTVAAKGSPEAIADLCHLNRKQTDNLDLSIRQLSARGYRILGVAGTHFHKADTAKKQHDYPFEFIGLIIFRDNVRPNTATAVRQCYGAGIRIIMITGDYAGTAQAVAKEIGLEHAENVLTGTDLATMSAGELRERIKTVNVFARVVPQQKLLIVEALKANGEIVAMTGDGVNDAPALKAAHVGIAMGERGTDVARETADLILLNDDFMSIVTATRMGRRIFDNLQKAMTYIVSVHIPIAGMAILPLLFGLPVVLLPAHIAFLELIIDPACSVVFEAEEEDDDIMSRPPRKLTEPLFGKGALVISLLQGFGVLLAVFLVYIIGLRMGLGETESRTLAFVTIVGANLLLILTNLSQKENSVTILFRKNRSLKWVLGSAFMGLSLVLYTPFLRGVFHFSVIRLPGLFIAAGIALCTVIWFRIIKTIHI
jgi:Ca2+-transporting ATPase